MKKLITALVVVAVLLIILLILGPFYLIQEGEQAVITRFGRIVDVVTDAGLHIKVPVVDNVVRYTKKILSWDGEAQRIPTKENQFIYVDPTSRWRIVDPAKFYETVNTVSNAQLRLDDVLDSTIRTVISENYLNEAVRNSNRINEITIVESSLSGVENLEDAENLRDLTKTNTKQEKITKGREALSNIMLDMGRVLTEEYGIYLEDIVIRQIRYSDDLTSSVYERMIKERNQIAEAYRSYGRGQQAMWEGKTENEKRTILSAAYAESEQIKGQADAEATRIYAEAYSADPEFFEFWRSLESYKKTMSGMDAVLSTGIPYFDGVYGL
ncbi:MAG: protease modulator HflC [Spirochaetales bacterium]|nr:protease modulator HflC [Spirochaetales bacterium]